MGNKKRGKYESKNKSTAVNRPHKGKYEAVRGPEVKAASKAKSQIDEEKIQAGQEVMDKYKGMLKELAGASLDIISGTAMRPIHKRLEKIQSVYSEKMKEMEKISKSSRNINADISLKKEKEIKRLDRFEDRNYDKINSSDLEDSVGWRIAKTLGRTYIGSYKARIAKMPYTLAARYQALRGNKEKQEELLVKARNASKNVMKKVKTKNFAYMRETQSRINKFNEVEEKTDLYYDREKKFGEIDRKTEEFIERNQNGERREMISLSLADIGQRRSFVGKKLSELIEESGNWIARKSALSGHKKFADLTANMTVGVANKIARDVATGNDFLYNELNRRVDGYDAAVAAQEISETRLEGMEGRRELANDVWAMTRGKLTLAKRAEIKGVKAITGTISGSTRYFSTKDMRLTTKYAKAVSVVGFDKHGKNVARRTENRITNNIIRAERMNTGVRNALDNPFGFREKRETQSKTVGKFLAEGAKAARKDISETWGEARDSFVDFVDEIGNKKTKHQVKRKYVAANRKVSALEFLSRNAQKVVDLIGPSLQDAKEVRAAAQAEMEMNPEKTEKPARRENRRKKNEGREYGD